MISNYIYINSLDEKDIEFTKLYDTNSRLAKDIQELEVLIGIISSNLYNFFGDSFISLCKVMLNNFLLKIIMNNNKTTFVSKSKIRLQEKIELLSRKGFNQMVNFFPDDIIDEY
jgi:hypothetical protein